MIRLFKFLFLFVLSIQVNVGFTAVLPKNYPHDLLYKGRPIDTLCFYELGSTEGFIVLDKCGLESESDREITFVDKKFINQGYIGYNYIWTINEIESHGLSYYKVLGKIKKDYIIFTMNQSGGTGDFTSLYRIRRDPDDRLHFMLLASGDRCNGGIISAEIKNNQLTYFTNVTSADFFTLTSRHIRDSKILSNLLDCAACCVATAKHEIIINEKHFDSKLMWIDLTTDKPSNIKPDNDYQRCFNQLFSNYINRKIRFLNNKEAENFVNEFNDQCIKK